MSTIGTRRMDWQTLAAKYFGSAFGVLLSMIFVAPSNTRNALYRILLAPVAGVIFSPPMQALVPFLAGTGFENHMAAACAAGFSCWFVLEFAARMLSSKEWLERTLQEVLRLKGGGDKK